MEEVRLDDILNGKISLVVATDKNGDDIRVGDIVVDRCKGESSSFYHLSYLERRKREICGIEEKITTGDYVITYKVVLSDFGIVRLEIVDRVWEGQEFLPCSNDSKLIINKISTWRVLEKI